METRSTVGSVGRTGDIPGAVASTIVDVAAGGVFDLVVKAVLKQIGDRSHRMLSYCGSIPGPTLRVQQGSHIEVNVSNLMDIETTVHWHGLRLENAYDGVPHATQAPIPPGGSYTHQLSFPDAGLFWYHPHMREDYAQEMGLYGNVIVEPRDASYWDPVDTEFVLTLDDVLIEDDAIAAYVPDDSNFVAMGRFGNVMLTGGETRPKLEVAAGGVARFFFTNTANTRVFKVALPGALMKLVGGDAGRFEREELVEEVVIAPSERAIVDVLFPDPGEVTLQHITPQRTYRLASVVVADGGSVGAAGGRFRTLRQDAEMAAERAGIQSYLDAPPDKTLALIAEMDLGRPEGEGETRWVCPMHPEVVSESEGSCPKCGMKLIAQVVRTEFVCPMHPEVVSDVPGKCPKCGMKLMPQAISTAPEHHMTHDHGESMQEGVEWEDMMFEVNRTTTTANTHWKLVDKDTGRENAAIDWTFNRGDRVKIRLVNEMESDHPMHHPFHVHGERFLVLARDGRPEENLVWKDTVLVRTGETIDILLDASNPGMWMAHCHIAEHMESGMMFTFRVLAGDGTG